MTVTNPPKLAVHLLRWYSERAQIDDLEGDIEELFHGDVKRSGGAIAIFNYWRRVLSLIFSYAITRRKRDAAFHHFSSTQF
jgi:putative ABC transport system permease protein